MLGVGFRYNENHDPKNGEFTTEGNHGGSGEENESSQDEAKPSLSKEEQDFVDDETNAQGAAKAGVISKDEADRKDLIENETGGFDKDDTASYTALHGFPTVKTEKGEMTEGGMPFDINYNQAELDEEAYNSYDDDDSSTWGLGDDQANDLAAKKEDVDSQNHDDPAGWDSANDPTIKALGDKWNELDQEEADQFEKENGAEVRERLKAFDLEIKTKAKEVKKNLKQKVFNNRKNAIAAEKRLQAEVDAIQAKMDAALDRLGEKDNGERD